jgi:hypothetical protein
MYTGSKCTQQARKGGVWGSSTWAQMLWHSRYVHNNVDMCSRDETLVCLCGGEGSFCVDTVIANQGYAEGCQCNTNLCV